MQEPHWIKHSHGKDTGCKKNGNDGDVKLVRPSKAMADALEAEGLHVKWPDYIYIPIKGTYTTADGSEKTLEIDLSGLEDSVETSDDVDSAVAHCLYVAYMDFNWRYELDENVLDDLCRNHNLCWDSVITHIENSKLTEKTLHRFYWVAMAIVHGDPIPPKEKWAAPCESVHISPKVATSILDFLKTAHLTMEPDANAHGIETIIGILADKLDVERPGEIERERL